VTVLVACETLLLVLLVLLVAGLLRSHAEILRRFGGPPGADQPDLAPAIPQPDQRGWSRRGSGSCWAKRPQGDAVKVAIGSQATLLAFLSSGCSVLRGVLERPPTGVAGPGMGIRLIALTRDPSEESPSRLRRLAGEATSVIMSSAAWRDYTVPAAPYFVYLDRGEVVGEGSATGWTQIESLLRDAIEDPTSHGGHRGSHERDRPGPWPQPASAQVTRACYPGREERRP